MSAALDRVSALYADANVKAMLHVCAAGETSPALTDADFRRCNVGPALTTWTHPWYGQTTTAVGHSTACGALQFLGTSWKEASDALGFGNDFSPINQLLVGVWTIDTKRHALAEVQNGDLAGAIAKLKDEWVSLQTLGMQRATSIFQQYGGILASGAVAPPSAGEQTPISPAQSTGAPMPAVALFQIFGPLLASLIPQLKTFFDPQTEVAKRNVGLAETVLQTITSAAGTDSLEKAITVMQADAAVKAKVQEAVVTHPEIMPMLQITEIGGGVQAAREADLKAAQADVPFYKNSAVFWISVLLLPMIYWYVGGSIVGGIGVPEDWPWYAQLPLKLFGTQWDDGAKVGLANLVVGLVLGGICGVFYGVSVTQAKQTAQTQQAAEKP